MNPAINALRTRLSAPLVLALLIGAAYGGSLRNEYVFDDLMFIRDDPRVRSLAEAPRLFVEPLWGYADKEGRVHLHQYYRPLQTFPLAVFYALTGERAWLAHLYSMVLHWLNCLLVFGILRRIVRDEPAALLAVALFAVHPGYSEAVLWVSDYAGLGAALCILSIFLLHQSGHGSRWYGWLLTAVLTLLGLWHKESGVLAPVLVAARDLLGIGRRVTGGELGVTSDEEDRVPVARKSSLSTLFRYSAFLPPILLYQHLRLRALGGMLPGFDTVPLTTYELVINAVGLIPDFVRTFFWPFALNMYHDFDAIHGIANARFLFGASVLLAGGVAFLTTVRRHPPVAFGLFWAMTTAAPHLVVRWPQLNVFAERYLYMPAVGLFLIAGYGLAAGRGAAATPAEGDGATPDPVATGGSETRAATGGHGAATGGHGAATGGHGAATGGRPYRFVGVAGVLMVFVIRVVVRVPDWHDDLVLYGKAVKQSRRASLVRNNLAVKLLELKRYDEGIALLEELKVLDPGWRDVNKNLGLLYLGKGDDAKAVESFEAAERADPFDRTVTLNLGYVYDRMGRRERAVEKYFELVNAEPRNTHGWYNLALIAAEAGQFGNARRALRHILRIDPADRPARALLRRLNKAAPVPLAVDGALTLRRCETARRAADDKRYAEATRTLQMAAWLDESSPLPHQYLANVAVLQGQLDRAVGHQRQALARAPANELYRRNLRSLEESLAARDPGAANP